ncbi:MAG: hemerythrin domain-containing protein [Chloroflexi bacterium]|nr:hemerythrin domain-containing protein [Chloroflexota bacterium]
MHATRLLRAMHSDAKLQLKVILGTQDSARAEQQWRALQPVLQLHEQLEDEFVYAPLSEEHGAGTPLGDWLIRHDSDVALVKELIAQVDKLAKGSPDWRMAVGQVTAALNKHVMDEEGQIFGRIEQTWDSERLEAVGVDMERALSKADQPAAASPVSRARRK